MKLFLFLSFFAVICSCNSSNQQAHEYNTTKNEKFVPDMYVPSEMTMLMRSMYTQHKEVKKNILNNQDIGSFPANYLQIDTAQLTDNKPFSKTFKAFSKVYIDNEKDLYDTNSNTFLTKKYNTTIHTCISCHQIECVGPIPRIKKLLIN